MGNYNDLKTLSDRKCFIEDLQKFVRICLPKNVNVFIFGSFLTEGFVPGKSDLDIALYAGDGVDKIEMDTLISDWIASRVKIEFDIIWIDVTGKHNYIDINPLLGYRLTEYYPAELTKHLAELTFALQREMEDRIRYKDVFEFALERRV